MVRAAAVYCRISDDRDGQAAGVGRQRDDCLALAERKGWPVGEVYVDNDVSAYSGKARRAYRRLLDDVKAGVVDAVVVWHLDRLHRQPRELEEFFDVCDRAGLKNLASVTGDVDLATDDGRFMARILGAVSRKESDDKSRRSKRKHAQLAAEGKGAGGGTRPFGFEADRVTIREDEAAHVRAAARRVLAGETVRSIAHDWNERGIATVTGARWTPHVLRRALMSPRVAGLREHLGKVTATACWPAILDEEVHARLRAKLGDPDRRTNGSARRYLLSGGLLRCGHCGAALVARPRADKRRCYVCAKGPGLPGCGRIRVLADPVEEWVSEAVLVALDSPALAAVMAESDSEEAQALTVAIASDEARLEELARDFYVDALIGRAEYRAAREGLERRLEAARRRLSRERGTTVLDGLVGLGDRLRETCESLPFDRRRAIIAAVVDHVVVGPAVRGRNRFDFSRLALVWRA